MNPLKPIPGLILLIIVLTLTIAAAQDKPQTKQAETLNAIPFDRVVLLTLQALEKNWKVKEKFLPNIHIDDYYFFVLRTAKRLALSDTSRVQTPIKKQEEK